MDLMSFGGLKVSDRTICERRQHAKRTKEPKGNLLFSGNLVKRNRQSK